MLYLIKLKSGDYGYCFPKTKTNENSISSQFAAKQQVFTNELSNSNVVRQPFHLYSLDMKLNLEEGGGGFSDCRHPHK